MGWIDLYDKHERKINLEAFGLIGLKLAIPSPSYSVELETIEGMDGEVEISRRLLPRNLTATFWIKSADYEDSLKARNDLYGFLGNGQEYFVAESKNPGRRWKVRVGDWDPKRINSRVQEIEIPLIAKSGLSETIILADRKFKKSIFSFDNEGNRVIQMTNQAETEIEFRGESSRLTITNRSTGDVWRHEGSTTAGDTILLKGVRSFKNGASIFGATNKKLLSFAPGHNDIIIDGAGADFELTIRTRFYFL